MARRRGWFVIASQLLIKGNLLGVHQCAALQMRSEMHQAQSTFQLADDGCLRLETVGGNCKSRIVFTIMDFVCYR